MNPSKDKGTRGETAVTRYAQSHGYPVAERRALHGQHDLGDVALCRGVIAEVKTGKHAQVASLLQITRWLDETERERRNAHAAIAVLVVQRQGLGLSRVGEWECWWRPPALDRVVTMTSLHDALQLIARLTDPTI